MTMMELPGRQYLRSSTHRPTSPPTPPVHAHVPMLNTMFGPEGSRGRGGTGREEGDVEGKDGEKGRMERQRACLPPQLRLGE
jgi:hypothetical protein